MNQNLFFSESGTFICDKNGILLQFDPAEENILCANQYKHLVVPEGVVGFCSNFGRSITVTERFILPQMLREIGNSNDSGVFADSTLPTVIIPERVAMFGQFAFGSSRIDALCLPAGFMSLQYVRQFKDACICKIYLHENEYHSGGAFLGFHWDCYYREVYTYKNREIGCLPTKSVLTPANRWTRELDW